MKKCVLILFVGLLFSCSKDSNNSDSVLNPPEWLYVFWEDERSQNDSFPHIQVEVSEKKVKIISGGGLSILDLLGMVRNVNDSPGASANIIEEISIEDVFEFTLQENYQNSEVQRTT